MASYWELLQQNERRLRDAFTTGGAPRAGSELSLLGFGTAGSPVYNNAINYLQSGETGGAQAYLSTQMVPAPAPAPAPTEPAPVTTAAAPPPTESAVPFSPIPPASTGGTTTPPPTPPPITIPPDSSAALETYSSTTFPIAQYGQTPSLALRNLLSQGDSVVTRLISGTPVPASELQTWWTETFLKEVDRLEASTTRTVQLAPGSETFSWGQVGGATERPREVETSPLQVEIDTAAVDALRTELGTLGLPPELRQQIDALLAEGGSIASIADRLRALNVPLGLQGQVDTLLSASARVSGILAGLQIPVGLGQDLFTLMSGGGTLSELENRLRDLRLPLGLEIDISSRMTALDALETRLGEFPGLPDSLGQELFSLMSAGILVDPGLPLQGEGTLTILERRLAELGVDPTTSAQIRAMALEVGTAATVLSGLQVPIELGQQLFALMSGGGTLSTLEAMLRDLRVNPVLAGQIMDRSLAVGALQASLDALGTPESLDLDLIRLTNDGSMLADLEGRLQALGLEDDFVQDLAGRIQDVGSLALALGSLTVPTSVKTDLFDMLGDATTEGTVALLSGRLGALGVPPELQQDITDRFQEVSDLSNALNFLEVPYWVAEDLSLLLSSGSDLRALQGELGGLGLPPELEEDLTDTLRRVSYLQSALTAVQGTGLAVSETVRAALAANISQLGIALTNTQTLAEELGNLGVPLSLTRDLASTMLSISDVSTALLGLESQGLVVSNDLYSLLDDNIQQIMGAEGREGLMDVLGKLSPELAPFAEELTRTLGDAQALRGVVGALEIPPEFRDALDDVIGQVTDPGGLAARLLDLNVPQPFIDQLTTQIGNLQGLNELLADVGLTLEQRREIQDALAAGQQLDEVLRGAAIPAETIAALDSALSTAGLTRQILSDVLGQIASLEVPPEFLSRLSEIQAQAAATAETVRRFGDTTRQTLGDVESQLRDVGRTAGTELGRIGAGLTLTQGTLGDVEARLTALRDPRLDPALKRLLTRPSTTPLEEDLQAKLTEAVQLLGFDPTAEREARRAVIDSDFEEARLSTARQFGITPGGEKSGIAERETTKWQIEKLRQYNQLEGELSERVVAARERSFQLLTDSLVQIGGQTLESEKLEETARQFNDSLQQRVDEFAKTHGLDERKTVALEAQIQSEIANATRKLAADVAQAWAQITGRTGSFSGQITAEDLGLTTTIDPGGWMPDAELLRTPQASAVRASYTAATGDLPSDADVVELLRGRSVAVTSMPTLEARRTAAQVTEQNMERVAKYGAIARELKLDEDKFERTKDQEDKQWSLTTLDVAPQFGLESDTFRTAKYYIDSQLNALFFQEDISPAERAAEESRIIDEAAEVYFPEQTGAFLQANDLFDRLYGDQKRQLIAASGMESEKYEMGSRQAQMQEDRMLATWASILSDEDVVIRQRVSDLPEFLSSSSYQSFRRETLQLLSDVPVPEENAGNAVDYVTYWLANASSDQVESVRAMFENTFDGLFPDTQFRFSLTNYVESVLSGEEDFYFESIASDWFRKLNSEKVQAVMALLGSPITPERQTGTWWEQLLQVGGSAAAAYAMTL